MKEKNSRVTISIPESLDLNFRKIGAVLKKFKRGWYGECLVEAIALWIAYKNGLVVRVDERTTPINIKEFYGETKVKV